MAWGLVSLAARGTSEGVRGPRFRDSKVHDNNDHNIMALY